MWPLCALVIFQETARLCGRTPVAQLRLPVHGSCDHRATGRAKLLL